MSRKKRYELQQGGASVELNIMPFIDIFSLLCTFLLFSAVFVSVGIIEVQAPFLTNAAPVKNPERKDEKKKDVSIMIDISKKSLSIRSIETGEREKIQSFQHDKFGVGEFHHALMQIKEKYPESEKSTVFTEEDVEYSEIIPVLDAIKFYENSLSERSASTGGSLEKHLFSKIVM